MNNKDLPAFPPNAGWEHPEAKGLTKRDYFAAMAMQGLLASMGAHDIRDYHDLSHDAVMCADAMLSELDKPKI